MKNTIIKIAFLITIIAIYSCNSTFKKQFEISGEVENGLIADTIKVYKNINLIEPIAYGLVENNKFTISGKIDTICVMYIGCDKIRVYNSFVLENGKYTCKVSANNVIVRGGNINEIVFGKLNDGEGEKINQEYENISIKAQSIHDDENALANLEEEMRVFSEKKEKFYNAHSKNIIEGNYPTEAKVVALTINNDEKTFPYEKRVELIKEYEKNIGANHPLLRGYQEQIDFLIELSNMSETVKNGSTFKPIIATNKNGENIKLSDIVAKNNYTLLEFWASWCSPCRAEIPSLKKAYSKYKNKGFEIYSISLDEKYDEWIEALDIEQTQWINVVDNKGFKSVHSRAYGINGIPASFLISKEGIIIESDPELRGKKLDIILEKLLK